GDSGSTTTSGSTPATDPNAHSGQGAMGQQPTGSHAHSEQGSAGNAGNSNSPASSSSSLSGFAPSTGDSSLGVFANQATDLNGSGGTNGKGTLSANDVLSGNSGDLLQNLSSSPSDGSGTTSPTTTANTATPAADTSTVALDAEALKALQAMVTAPDTSHHH
ncbi:MAG: hypothetical protein KGK17_06430, partial [Betaproteobacteria bacterium]|nr:hypothetical protein [Betaproteobacteria bacterium]